MGPLYSDKVILRVLSPLNNKKREIDVTKNGKNFLVPSLHSCEVQASSRPESNHPKSSHPESKRRESNRPIVQSPSVQSPNNQTMRPESSFSGTRNLLAKNKNFIMFILEILKISDTGTLDFIYYSLP